MDIDIDSPLAKWRSLECEGIQFSHLMVGFYHHQIYPIYPHPPFENHCYDHLHSSITEITSHRNLFVRNTNKRARNLQFYWALKLLNEDPRLTVKLGDFVPGRQR